MSTGNVVLGLRPENFHELLPADVDPALTAPLADATSNWPSRWAPRCTSTPRRRHTIIARVSPRCRARPGDRLTLTADLSMAHLFDSETEEALGP